MSANIHSVAERNGLMKTKQKQKNYKKYTNILLRYVKFILENSDNSVLLLAQNIFVQQRSLNK